MQLFSEARTGLCVPAFYRWHRVLTRQESKNFARKSTLYDSLSNIRSIIVNDGIFISNCSWNNFSWRKNLSWNMREQWRLSLLSFRLSWTFWLLLLLKISAVISKIKNNICILDHMLIYVIQKWETFVFSRLVQAVRRHLFIRCLVRPQ